MRSLGRLSARIEVRACELRVCRIYFVVLSDREKVGIHSDVEILMKISEDGFMVIGLPSAGDASRFWGTMRNCLRRLW
jgi:hypothetical protein